MEIQYTVDGLKTGGIFMAEDMLNNNTAGEAGSNTSAESVNYEKIVNDVLHAIETKNAKNEQSIISSNFDKLSNEDRQAAYDLFYAKKNAEAEKAKRAEAEQRKQFESMQKELEAYRTKEKVSTLTNKANELLAALDCTDEGARKQAIKLSLAGVNADDYFNEDKSINEEELKKVLEATLKDVPSLISKKQKEVKIEIGNEKDSSAEDDMTRMLKAVGYKFN